MISIYGNPACAMVAAWRRYAGGAAALCAGPRFDGAQLIVDGSSSRDAFGLR